MKTQKQIDGYEFTKGAIQCLCKFFAVPIALAVIFTLLISEFGWFTDATDVDGWHRSGMSLHTDAATGVQYLSDGRGGLTPRLLPDGKLFADGEKAK